MVEENLSHEFTLKNIDKTKICFLEKNKAK